MLHNSLATFLSIQSKISTLTNSSIYFTSCFLWVRVARLFSYNVMFFVLFVFVLCLVSLDCPLLIVPSAFPNVYLYLIITEIMLKVALKPLPQVCTCINGKHQSCHIFIFQVAQTWVVLNKYQNKDIKLFYYGMPKIRFLIDCIIFSSS